jgi:hypothetical protein
MNSRSRKCIRGCTHDILLHQHRSGPSEAICGPRGQVLRWQRQVVRGWGQVLRWHRGGEGCQLPTAELPAAPPPPSEAKYIAVVIQVRVLFRVRAINSHAIRWHVISAQ